MNTDLLIALCIAAYATVGIAVMLVARQRKAFKDADAMEAAGMAITIIMVWPVMMLVAILLGFGNWLRK